MDLDPKPAAKIPGHFELDRRIIMCALQRPWLLRDIGYQYGGA